MIAQSEMTDLRKDHSRKADEGAQTGACDLPDAPLAMPLQRLESGWLAGWAELFRGGWRVHPPADGS
ncbi:hypothetical protein [Pseudogemmobacter sonorensis]|uniref:hypothetical protein n=1 Tax=Pseudogemmobacter sonorensis TaxID=2989681 RepID=UPI0036C76A1F